MKATELMIGDWVYNSYHKKNIKWNYSEMFCPNGIPVIGRDLKPIPLTEEILAKNGFVLRGKTYILIWRGVEIHWRKTDGYASITAPNNLKLEGWCSISNGYFCYVHILQHALRLCGFDELAENFKV